MDVNFPWDDPRFHNRMEHNLIPDEPPEGSLADLCETIFPAMITGFDPIPLDRIGRNRD